MYIVVLTSFKYDWENILTAYLKHITQGGCVGSGRG